MTDDRSAAKRRKADLLEAARVDSFISEMLSRREGRDFIWWLISVGGWGGQPHTSNALNTAFNCGALNVANQIVARLGHVNPAGFVRMQMERLDERSEHADGPTSTGLGTRFPAAEPGESDDGAGEDA